MDVNNLSKKQVVRNLGINTVNFIVNIAYGLIMTPFLIRMIGLGSFGIVQVAISISMYIGLVTSSLNQANNRYISISIADNEKNDTIEILNTIINIYILFIACLLPFILAGSFFSDYFLDIPEKDVFGVKFLLLTMSVSYLMVMFISVFTSPLYVNNRLDVIQLINIARNLFKLLFTYFFILIISKNIAFVGLGALLSSLIAMIIAMIIFKKQLPYFRFSFFAFKQNFTKKIISFSLWTVVNEIGTLLFIQADILIINIFLGKECSGQYGVIFQWSTMLRNLAIITSVVMSPVILIKYSQGKYKELKEFISKALKYQGLFISILTALVITFGKPLFKLWLGEEYLYLLPYLYLAIFHFSLTQAIRPLYSMNTAYNKVKEIGKLSLLFGIIHIVFSIILIRIFNFGIYGSLISGAALSILLNIIILPVYVSGYLNMNKRSMYFGLIPGVVIQIVTIIMGQVLQYFYIIDTWIDLIGIGFLILILSMTFCYVFLLNNKERRDLIGIFIRSKDEVKS